MKRILPLLLVLLAGCTFGRDHLLDTAREVNQTAFDGKIKAEIVYCNRRQHPECWSHHGLFDPSSPVPVIHIAPEWAWEPDWYYRGILAHEMIHALLYQTGEEKVQAHPHSWRFKQERERVAAALNIPVWAIPDGKHEDKLDATRDMAYLEASFNAMRMEKHGVIMTSPGTAGWPTQLYDPEED